MVSATNASAPAPERAVEIAKLLADTYPGSASELCALAHRDPFQLLVATILSAQCTDERVNQVTPKLFERYPGPEDLAAADVEELESLIRPTGFFRSKAASLIGMAAGVSGQHHGEVPTSMEELVKLPGVGRKTANVILSVAMNTPGLAVDTHVGRLARRLGLSASKDPEKVEAELCALLPEGEWGPISLRLILHGRRICGARKARCEQCVLVGLCPSAGKVSQ